MINQNVNNYDFWKKSLTYAFDILMEQQLVLDYDTDASCAWMKHSAASVLCSSCILAYDQLKPFPIKIQCTFSVEIPFFIKNKHLFDHIYFWVVYYNNDKQIKKRITLIILYTLSIGSLQQLSVRILLPAKQGANFDFRELML